VVAAGALSKIGLTKGIETPSTIDRHTLVSRHDPVLKKFEPLSPLSVGNGEFAFTCDVTGLQTFSELYKDAMPLCTMSQWGWHTTPMPDHLKGKTFRLTDYDTYGRKVGYMTSSDGQKELYDYLRQNPHRLHLGQIGFRLIKADGDEAKPTDIADIEQTLDLWTGTIHSNFRFEGKAVRIRTAVHPAIDLIAVNVESDLIHDDKLSVRLAFPYGSPTMQAADWSQTDKHRSSLNVTTSNTAEIARVVDNDTYAASLKWSGSATINENGAHEFFLKPRSSSTFEVALKFSESGNKARVPAANIVFAETESYWKNFWTNGTAIELSASKDARAPELERRVILSQYLTAINCSGSLPAQETGLTCNSWYGKFHLEMHWWHAAHFALWNRVPMLEKSLGFYNDILPSARERAKQQGYAGARWPKMTSPDGRDSPSPIGPLLIWQQTHPIFYAELVYLSRPTAETLKRYSQIVFDTAEFMASYAHFDAATNRYVLGPPVIPAQENHPPRETWNPTFELEYWHFGLSTAQKWRTRMRMPRVAKWDDVLIMLSKLPSKDGVYLAHENCPQTFAERNRDHPSMLAALGMLTGSMVNRETMRRTLKKVMTEWNWAETWGWDYPMTAMTAARLGEPDLAIDALLIDTPKNRYLANGHNYQRADLPLYLPGNGGLLYAIAMMANGWKDSPQKQAPGFPSNGKWTVGSEGFNPAIFREI
jgi:hypothetical protein